MRHLLAVIVLFIAVSANAQNVGIGTSSPNSNAKLDITATDKGVLIPRMDSVHRKAIPNTIGLLVYDSTSKSFWYNNGMAWQNMATAASGWALTGNSGIDTSINFLGTTDYTPLLFRFNNSPAGKISSGMVSMGVNAYSGEGNQIVAIGTGALAHNIKFSGTGIGGYGNTAVGGNALASNTNGAYATAIGAGALSFCKSCNGTAVGATSMLRNETGGDNSAFGEASLYNNTSGSRNTVMGTYALSSNGSGNNNTAVGVQAGLFTTTSGNTTIGAYSLYTNISGSNNTALGYKSDLAAQANINNATAIGANAVADASNKIRLGDNNVTVVESNGVFNTVSDGRFKYNIQEDVKGLDFIMQLRPVTYQFDAKKQEDFTKGVIDATALNTHIIPAAFNENNAIKRTGFIAQEVEKAAQKTGYDFDGVKIPATDKQYYSLSYASFVVPLVKAVQEQQQTIETLKKQNELLQQQNKQAQQQNEQVQQQNKIIIKRLETLEKNNE